jgi:hypothetical protein
VVQAEPARKIFNRTKVVSDHRDAVVLWGLKEVKNFSVEFFSGLFKENIFQNALVDSWTGDFLERDEGAVLEVSTPPKIDGRCVSVVTNKHVGKKFDFGEIKVVFSREDKGGTGGEEREVERVEIFQRGGNPKEELRANEGGVGVSSPVEGGDREANGFLNWVVHISRENEEEHMIREERDDKRVDEKDFFV